MPPDVNFARAPLPEVLGISGVEVKANTEARSERNDASTRMLSCVLSMPHARCAGITFGGEYKHLHRVRAAASLNVLRTTHIMGLSILVGDRQRRVINTND